MIPLSAIRNTVIDWIEDDSTDTIEVIDRTINTQLRFLCKMDFDALQETYTATPDSNGIIVEPPACDRIIDIVDYADRGSFPDLKYYRKAMVNRSDSPRTKRYFFYPAGVRKSSDATDIVFSGTHGSETLTYVSGTAIVDGHANLELHLAGDNTRYLITGVVAGTSVDVFPSLRRTSSTSIASVLNPAGLRQYALAKNDNTVVVDDVTVIYQMQHPPLVDDDDLLLIPMERTLSLMTVQHFLGQSKYDVDAERLETAIFLAKQVEYGVDATNIQDSAPLNPMFSFRTKRASNGR